MSRERLTWSIDAAAREFALDRRTLANLLRAAGFETGRGVNFTTQQIVKAIEPRQSEQDQCLNLDAENARLAAERADEIAMRNEISRRELVHIDTFCKLLASNFAGMLAVIEASALSDLDKDALRLTLAESIDPDAVRKRLRR